MPWRLAIDPDVEWVSYPPNTPFDDIEDAVQFLRQHPEWYTPDEYGNQPRPYLIEVDHEDLYGMAPKFCSCYGRLECAACQLARLEAIVDEQAYIDDAPDYFHDQTEAANWVAPFVAWVLRGPDVPSDHRDELEAELAMYLAKGLLKPAEVPRYIREYAEHFGLEHALQMEVE